jgi:hypothetical protein
MLGQYVLQILSKFLLEGLAISVSSCDFLR